MVHGLVRLDFLADRVLGGCEMSRWLFRPSPGRSFVCQINGPFDEARKTRLPAQCCGKPADQIWKCEQIAAPGHRCRVDDHTILHERMGNGYHCSTVEYRLRERGGLHGWVIGRMPGEPAEGSPQPRSEVSDHPFEGDGKYCRAWIDLPASGTSESGVLTMRAGCGYPRETHPDQARGD